MVKDWIRLVPFLFILFACAPAKPIAPYIASKAVLEKLQPDRETIPARKGCDVCHRVLADRIVYKYYPVRMSHKAHAALGIQCIFCHRKAPSSTKTGDYLLPAGHGFAGKGVDAFSNNTSHDNNPCKACHLYLSDFGKKDRRIPAGCETCHPAYSAKKPLPFKWVRWSTNLINNHKTHYDMGVPCQRCHPGFDMVEAIVPNFIPKMDICTECHSADGERKKTIREAEADPMETAKLLYRQNCAMCHGMGGKGDGAVAAFFKAGLKPRDLTDAAHMSKRVEGQIHDVILKGGLELGLSERMPAFEGLLKEDEIALLVRYIRHISNP